MNHHKAFLSLLTIGSILRVSLAAIWGPWQSDFQGISERFGFESNHTSIILFSLFVGIVFITTAYLTTLALYGDKAAVRIGIVAALLPWPVHISAQGFLEPFVASLYMIAIAAVIIGWRYGFMVESVGLAIFALGIAAYLKPKIYLLIPILRDPHYNLFIAYGMAIAAAILYGFPVWLAWIGEHSLKWCRERVLLIISAILPFIVAGPIAEAFRLTEGGGPRGDIFRYSLSGLIPLAWVIVHANHKKGSVKLLLTAILILWILILPSILDAPRV